MYKLGAKVPHNDSKFNRNPSTYSFICRAFEPIEIADVQTHTFDLPGDYGANVSSQNSKQLAKMIGLQAYF